ncbi:putative hydrolase [Actinoplanes lutulentus]|uniref:Putative hydrolase n=1 Tax=Actinoplanes lutulentus TaxID=1287878 RepID=A0A327ZD63_9ACTN|nr:hydrolase [Actinoplanes lutulentus]MBB2945881.1 putative hydrolase [Actinoplanes lutulentus]RAK37930.1 putative hydrolase [Actinoplanes lutulentus]
MVVERETVVAGVLDLTVDAHVHTGFSSGREAVGVVVSAADRAGLTALTFADQAGPDTAWLTAYADAVRRARHRTELTLRVAAEVEVVRPDGWLALPPDLAQLDALSVAVSALPIGGELLDARQIRDRLDAGVFTSAQVAEHLVGATIKGIERASRYVPAQLARPLALLAQSGVDDSAVSPELVADLAAACRSTGTVVEISEAWRSPSPRMVQALRDAAVALVPASDARYAAEVGRWQYLRRV